jgi:FkbM family methyltransferase
VRLGTPFSRELLNPLSTQLPNGSTSSLLLMSSSLRYLRPSGAFVDVGANVGAISLPVAACRPNARIICIEADPEIVSLLRRNVAENGRSNVRIIHCLAGPFDDPQIPFYRAPAAKFGMGSVGPQFGAAPITLTQHPLDEVLDELAIDNDWAERRIAEPIEYARHPALVERPEREARQPSLAGEHIGNRAHDAPDQIEREPAFIHASECS